jgi:SAM-dependent methyltransferase
MTQCSRFDEYAEEYELNLSRGLKITGEEKDYFARGRVAWLEACLRSLAQRSQRIMDFGCGTGSTSALLLELLNPKLVVGVDSSPKSLEIAQNTYGGKQISFTLTENWRPNEDIDLIYCNGVFHHIPPNDRAVALGCLWRSIRPGGFFAFWENNPWNPGTRLVMSRIPFDKDAVTITPLQARRLLSRAGFEVVRTDFLFVFPRALKWLRVLEPLVSSLPVGAQFQVLCRKPQS